MLKRTTTLLFISALLSTCIYAQDKVTFLASDKLIITADAYVVNDTLPYIILCHDENSSRGEYKETAKKFTKLGYNSLAIDLRSGNVKFGEQNETNLRADAKKFPMGLMDTKIDIEAAINYAFTQSHKKVVLVGSGFSASLALYLASSNPRVCGAMAFSPKDYFSGKLKTSDVFPKCTKPVLVASAKSEAETAKKYVSAIPSASLTLFAPPNEGAHGSAALYTSDTEYHAYWISILMFMRNVHP